MTKSFQFKLCYWATIVPMALTLMSPPAVSQEPVLKRPNRQAQITRSQKAQWTENTLLVMPFNSKGEDSRDLVADLKGTITGTIGSGATTVWIVHFDNVKEFAKAEREFGKSKHINAVQRDYILTTNGDPGVVVNDPYFSQQWHLPALNAPRAYSLLQQPSAFDDNPTLLDTGVDSVIGSGQSASEVELVAGLSYDATNPNSGPAELPDVTGHGTLVASSAFSWTNNGSLLAGVGPNINVRPIRVVDSRGRATTSALIEAIRYLSEEGAPDRLLKPLIVNISLNAPPPYSLANPRVFPALHEYFKRFHDEEDGGLIFCAAGNNHSYDQNPRLPYLIVVSAINNNFELASFSNWGNPVWFTAPGTNILTFDKNRNVRSVSGTSFSCPLVTAIAFAIKSTFDGQAANRITTVR